MRILNKILDFLPIPFWVYFLSILAGTIGLLPQKTPIYDLITRHALPAAIILMLIGTPVSDLLKLGPNALIALAIGTGTIFFSQICAYLALIKFMPPDAWKSVGALMGTWIGGSANMVAVKEILQLPDSGLGPLVIVDTLLSYGWMAFLLAGVRFQKSFDRVPSISNFNNPLLNQTKKNVTGYFWLVVLIVGFLIAEISIFIGIGLAHQFSFLSVNAWALLAASTLAILFSLTPLRGLSKGGSQKIGTLLLYLVLITIGAKTNIRESVQSSIFFIYGLLVLIFHGVLSIGLGRYFKIPLFLLSTSSQANIGGAVSAPIVAEAYQPGTAHIGVLMAVAGAVMGTYLGVLGGTLCRMLGSLIQ